MADSTDSPAHIGPYRILEALGAGGMGEVYLAEQRAPVRRRVAIKLIKLGMDSKQVLARFEAERQALAMMNHDNIARVFDAGTTERGQPYFVMEHVEGIPISSYCDQHRLTIDERVELFRQVCSGVQHAHQKGIIHRDLKPGNVLVTRRDERAIPKIIDFGLARATNYQLTEQTLFTEQGQVIGTPEYMSPEQAAFDAQGIDTRTDLYSLGVMLYELLAGALPFPSRELRSAGVFEVQRRIREEQPARPSTRVAAAGEAAAAACRRTNPGAWCRQLRGELDWIVLKAMAKEPERRYDSATGLSLDLGRYLEHEPVLAGPPSASYRLRKLVQRHRGKVVAAALVLATLVAGVLGTTWFAVAAGQEREAVLRLADDKLVDEYSAEADQLWPAHPDRIAGMGEWIDKASALMSHLQVHESTRESLRALALDPETGAAEPPPAAVTARLKEMQGRLEFLSRALAAREGNAPELPDFERRPGRGWLYAVLNELAWRSVSPNRKVFGNEAMALTRVQRIKESRARKGGVMLLSERDTLSWALHANGFDEAARAESQQVVALAEQQSGRERMIQFQHQLSRLIEADASPAAKEDARHEIKELQDAIHELEQALAERRTYRFAKTEVQWQYDLVAQLIDKLETFGDPDPDIGTIASVRRRLEFAVETERLGRDAATAAAWQKAIASIRDRDQCPMYAGLELAPQFGLVPIGRDPHSGLWEFSHLQTGRVATRDANHDLMLTPESGLVFVLLPGGTFRMGAEFKDGEEKDPDSDPDMMPEHDVTLAPFFLSKFEMTQAQWRRFTGRNPSTFASSKTFGGVYPADLHPVETVTWNDCHEVMRRLGLALPTEAQWEYAARAGTSTPWWTPPRDGEEAAAAADRGGILASAQVKEGLLDRLDMLGMLVQTWIGGTLSAHAPVWSPRDGGDLAAPTARANRFGIHDTIGNVWEWCLDLYESYGYPATPGTGERAGDGSDPRRVARGGSFANPAKRAHSALRYPMAPEVADPTIGVRPARRIDAGN